MKKIIFLTVFIQLLALNLVFGQNTVGELTFTVKTITDNGNYAPKHVLAIWVEDADGFVKTQKRRAQNRKQYLYKWRAASDYNDIDAVTGATLNSHTTHNITWDCTDVNGNIVPDGEYTLFVEFTEKHAQGPWVAISFNKSTEQQIIIPDDEAHFENMILEYMPTNVNIVADFTLSAEEVCELEAFEITNTSDGNIETYSWDFGDGATPSNSSEENPPSIYYTTDGLKTIALTINQGLDNEATLEKQITVDTKPTAGYMLDINGLTVDITNTSANANSYLFIVDNETNYTQVPEQLIFDVAGEHSLELIATNEFGCTDTSFLTISLTPIGIDKQINISDIQIVYETQNMLLNINSENIEILGSTIQLFSSDGKLIYNKNIGSQIKTLINLSGYKSGYYIVVLSGKDFYYSDKIIIP